MITRFGLRNFSSATSKKVGFMGLGNMGFSMMRNCMSHGYEITAYDVDDKILEKAEELGAKIAPDVKAAATDQDFCLTMLPNTDIVEQTRMGSNGIFENAREGAYIIDSSTISPSASRKMAEEGAKLGFKVADAPVSGGVTGAEAGTLTFMVGCKKDHFDGVKDFLISMGSNVFHCGAPGTGQTSKICNNLMLAIQMMAVSEGLALGEKLGIDPAVLSKICSTSTSSCWTLNTYNPRPGILEGVPSSNNYDGGFGVSLIKKDLSIVLDSAAEVNLDLQFGTKAIEFYHELERQGKGNKDFGIVYQYINSLEKK